MTPHASHRFDPASGWCIHRCGWRDDGARAGRSAPPEAAPPQPVIDFTEPRHSPTETP
jgi:hypothetical protein